MKRPVDGRRTWLVLCSLFGLASCSDDPGQMVYESQATRGFTEAELRGESVYLKYCVGCHGVEGNGQGPAAPFLDPRPRDLTRGVFKFRRTPTGSLPTDEDLMRTLREGVHGTAMPSWREVPEHELVAVIAYLKTFSERFQRSKPGRSLAIGSPPDDLMSAPRIERGHEVWNTMQCAKCHGERGKGDGPTSDQLVDSEGNRIVPFDFTRKQAKGGSRPEDFYRTFMTGLDGTPMPSFGEDIPEIEDRWSLVAFVLSLRENPETAP